ncbi:MAG: EAL domain-containing protein [Candidatus Dactylopiibacterium sp.]|nr:EAL domain-containing protein [Candidatus Dactylopiibacterium sp.]
MHSIRESERRAVPHGVPGTLHSYLAEGDWVDGRLELSWAGYRLSSVFQPIVSFSHSCVVAHEALLRAQDRDGRKIAPTTLFSPLLDARDLVHLDRASRLMHILNSRRAPGCFFLNLHPRLFDSLAEDGSGHVVQAVRELVDSTASRYVIEIVEENISDEDGFEDGVAALRRAGFGIALDDFGTGHSNFDRVWKIRPDVVKLDGSFARRAYEDRSVRRLLPHIVSLLHEAGTLVLLEGIETLEQARIALDANVDFGQGWYFAFPASDPGSEDDAVTTRLGNVWANAGAQAGAPDLAQRLRTSCERSLYDAASRLVRGESFVSAAQSWLAHPHAHAAFLLDADGVQIENLDADDVPATAGGFHLGRGLGTRWSRADYFVEAMRTPGEVKITRPYLSAASGRLCVTLSLCVVVGGRRTVLCGDVDWRSFESAVPRRFRIV